jgi:hypothetical protein
MEAERRVVPAGTERLAAHSLFIAAKVSEAERTSLWAQSVGAPSSLRFLRSLRTRRFASFPKKNRSEQSDGLFDEADRSGRGRRSGRKVGRQVPRSGEKQRHKARLSASVDAFCFDKA